MIHNIDCNNYPYKNSYVSQEAEKKPYHNSSRVEKITLHIFKDFIWTKTTYGITIIVKFATVLSEIAPNIVRVIKALGIAMIINAGLTLSALPEHIAKLIHNFSLKDIEGTLLSGLDLIANPLNALDAFTTFITTLSDIEAIPVIAFFSVIALPLTISLLGYQILRVSYDLVHLGLMKHQTIKKVSTAADIQQLKAYLENQLTVANEKVEKIGNKQDIEGLSGRVEQLRLRKINKLTRRADEKIVHLMQNLLNRINENENDIDTVNGALSDIHTLLKRKMTCKAAGLGAHIVYLAALVSSVALPILSPVVVPLVSAARQVVLLGVHDYQKGTLAGIKPSGIIINGPAYENFAKSR